MLDMLKMEVAGKPTMAAQAQTLSILLAEDNPVNQHVARLMLKRLGYQADVVENGREALDALEQQNYDIILMDMQMPEMDGLTATMEIRQRHAHQPYIIAMTANAMESDREACIAAGMNDYVSKPIQLATLRQALESAHPLPPPAMPAPPTPPANLRDAVDINALVQQWGIPPAQALQFVKSMAEVFLQEAQANIQKMRSAARSNQATEFWQAAHLLKGMSGNFGARPLAGLCAEAEKRGRAGELAAIDGLLDMIAHELERVCTHIQALE